MALPLALLRCVVLVITMLLTRAKRSLHHEQQPRQSSSQQAVEALAATVRWPGQGRCQPRSLADLQEPSLPAMSAWQ